MKIAEIGNSIAIRIPKEIVEFLRLDKGKEVTVFPESKQVLSISILNLL